MFHRGWFQVAVREAALQDAVCRVLMHYGTARISRAEASGWPDLGTAARYAGIVAEWAQGFEEWLTSVRKAAPCLPVLVFAGPEQLHLFNALHTLGVEVALSPLYVPQLVTFAQRALSCAFLPSENVGRLVAALARTRNLTPREVQLLCYCLADEPRARVRRRLGITENTLKTQIKALLRKCGERNVDALAKNVLRAALLERVPAYWRQAPVAPWYPLRDAA